MWGICNSKTGTSVAPLCPRKTSLGAMAELLRKAEPGTYEHTKSADYLADSGDQQWFPLLLEVAQKNARIASYVDDAAKLGGDRMLPALVALANSPDKEFARINAVTAMGFTSSRTAIPILLDFLQESALRSQQLP